MFCTTSKDVDLLSGYLLDPAFNIHSLLKGQWAQGVWEPENGPPHDNHGPRLAGIHASDVSTCLRKAGYSFAGAVGDHRPPPSATQRLALGHLVHRLIQGTLLTLHGTRSKQGAVLQFYPEVVVDDTPVAKQLNLRSRCDGVFSFSSEDGDMLFRVGIEIKSESSSTWKRRICPDPKHIQQSMIYMACLDLPAMYFIYVDKESGEPTPFNSSFVIPFDEMSWKKLVEERIDPVRGASNPLDLPAETGFHCDFCSYKKKCNPQARPLPTIRLPKKG